MATTEYSPELNKKKTALGTFIVSLMASAKTSGLYKPGHPMLQQIGERMVNLLNQTMGQGTSLTAEVKAKVVTVDDSELEEVPEVVTFAVALHTLGVGGIVFTNRMTTEGMLDFFKVLIAKPDENNTLTDLQKSIQGVKIDGLTLTFILNFVVTGEQDERSQVPGQLSEEQILAFLKARTLPDFIAFLLKQNEELTSKDAETIGGLCDGLLYRDISMEKFEEEMAWSFYDERIKERWDYFRSQMVWKPKNDRGDGEPRQRWERFALESWASLATQNDLTILEDHHVHEKTEALGFALDKIHTILDDPIAGSQLKYAVFAYARVLAEYGRDGNIQVLMTEFDRFLPMAQDEARKLHYDLLRTQLLEKLNKQMFIDQLVTHLAGIESDSEDFNKIREFIIFLGEDAMPLLVDGMRRVTDKPHLALLAHLAAQLCGTLGQKAVVEALADEDWFLVVSLVGVFTEIGDAAAVELVGPLLKRGHHRIREAACKFCLKFGGDIAVDALAAYIGESKYPEEMPKIIIKFSQMRHPKLGDKFVAAFRKTSDYDVQVSLVTAMGRLSGAAVLGVLTETARRTWYEILTGHNKALRSAARESLVQIQKGGGS